MSTKNSDESDAPPPDGAAPPAEAPTTTAVPTPEIEDLKNQLKTAETRIDETYKAYLSGQERISQMERRWEERTREEARPAILDEQEDLEQAIRYVQQKEQARPSDKDIWISSLQRAIPDLDSLMKDADFERTALEERTKIGERAWQDPLTAIRSMATLRAEYLAKKAVSEDRSSYRKIENKTEVMEVPGGSSRGVARTEEVDEAEQIRNMSSADFAKLRAKVLGYSS